MASPAALTPLRWEKKTKYRGELAHKNGRIAARERQTRSDVGSASRSATTAILCSLLMQYASRWPCSTTLPRRLRCFYPKFSILDFFVPGSTSIFAAIELVLATNSYFRPLILCMLLAFPWAGMSAGTSGAWRRITLVNSFEDPYPIF
jgi:hypothetical protein